MTPPSATTTPARAPALPPDERRAAIITAAIPLLRANGSRVTTREIADAAGIAEGTIFRVFDTKDDLIHAVVEQVMDVSETVDAIRAIDSRLPLADRVRTCVEILSARLKSVFDIMVALHPRGREPGDAPQQHQRRNPQPDPRRNPPQDHRRNPPQDHHHDAHDANDRRHAEVLDAIATVFAPSDGLLSCSPRRAASLLRTLAWSGAHPMIAGNDHLSADEITDVLLHGIVRHPAANTASVGTGSAVIQDHQAQPAPHPHPAAAAADLLAHQPESAHAPC